MRDEPARPPGDIVLIVDDVPDNVSVLHDALDAAGYTVVVALDGASALRRAAQLQPDVVLLDALMPGMDGFEVARRLKADPETAHLPIVFMTGLTETEHVVAAFAAGGIDYVTKPIRPPEVLARVAAHMAGARASRQARNALDAHGQATLAVRQLAGPLGDLQVVWQTPLARRLRQRYFPETHSDALSPMVAGWLAIAQADTAASAGAGFGTASPAPTSQCTVSLPTADRAPGARSGVPVVAERDGGIDDRASAAADRLVLTLQQRTADGDWLIVMREVSDTARLDALVRAHQLTLREAEVLNWLTKGKTNRDIADILGTSPATVKKQLEHVYAKLGVETRTAAAGVALASLA